MLISLQKIGNSRGIVIPKPLIEELHLTNKIELLIEHDALMIRNPNKNIRNGWREASQRLSRQGDDHLVWPEFTNDEDKDLIW